MLIVLLAASFLHPTAGSSAKSPAVTYAVRRAAGIRLHVIQADVRRSDVNLAIVTSKKGIGSREPWSTLIDRSRPVAAITGTYFDTISGIPIGSIGVGGKLVHNGFIGTGFSYMPNGGLNMQSIPPLRTFDFTGAETWVRAGPRLLTGGRTTLNPRFEGFRDPAIFMRKKRTAVAITRAGKLLLIAVEQPVTLQQLAAALKGIGAMDAMCLDGGGSAGIYYGGKTRVLPRRPLTNLLVVYDTADRYRSQLPGLTS